MFNFLSNKFSGILSWVKDKGRLSEENIFDAETQVRDALLEADVPYHVVDEFVNKIKEEVIGQKITSKVNPGQLLIKIVYDQLLSFLGGKDSNKITFQIPSVIMMMGLQGSGKTTTISKLANWLLLESQKRGKARKILLASVDFYRPAAIDQLELLAKQINVDFYRAKHTDVVKATREIREAYKDKGYEYLFLDTSGRLHVDNEMMGELREIDLIMSPKYKILILDSMTGQESLKIAQAFEQDIGFSGVILTKMDSDTRGGAAFSFKYSLKKPIYFVGSGEKVNDLELFIPERMASRILGMGDILTLIEKADLQGNGLQDDVAYKMMSGGFNLEDFLKQLDIISKMGSMQKLVRYLPGMPNITPEAIEAGEQEVKRFRAIISSMTVKERRFPQLLDASRKLRIARGSGTNVQEINKLLQRLQQSKQFAKMFKKIGR